jgi:hypothetical protein
MDIINVIAIIADVAVILGVPVALWSVLSIHERTKKQETIEFYHQISIETRELSRVMSSTFGNDTINITDERFKDNKNMQNCTTRYLSLMERLSVGINMGVYDLKTYNRLSGSLTIRMYNRLSNIIRDKRIERGQPTLYIEFERLAQELKKRRDPKTKDDSGKLRYS